MNTELNLITVGLGELKISTDPHDVLIAYGLGSCVGVGIYDAVAHVGGLLHAMLPERNGAGNGDAAKYVDSGIAEMLRQLSTLGALKHRLMIRAAGGANMLTVSDLKRTLNIGERNVAAMQATLTALRLPVQAQLLGGSVGRTVRLYVASGRMTVRMLGGQEQDLS